MLADTIVQAQMTDARPDGFRWRAFCPQADVGILFKLNWSISPLMVKASNASAVPLLIQTIP